MDKSIEKIKFTTTERIYKCPICGGEIHVPSNLFYGRCQTCKMTLIDYNPAPHQLEFHKSTAQYKLNIGGFGSGKTTMCCAEITRHALSVPNGQTLITAQKLQQVNDAVIPELMRFIPPWYIIGGKPVQKPNFTLTLKNGHKFVVFASDDEQKIRSLNLTAFYIEEASGVDKSVFTQCQARLRNSAGIIRDSEGNEIGDNYLGLLCSNPDDCWFVDDFLLISNKIHTSNSIDPETYNKIKSTAPQEYYESFLSSTRDNVYLPKNFIPRLCAGKSRSWIRKYIDCYLDSKEGAVYTEFANCIETPFNIPKFWKRVVGFDKGWEDPTAFLIGAIDPVTGVVHFYQEYYVQHEPLTKHARCLKEALFGLSLYNNVQADPSVRNKGDRDGSTYQMHFLEVSGIFLEPADNSLDSGIEKVRDFMYNNRVRFFSTLDNTKMEAIKYRFPDRKDLNTNDKPKDRYNHLMDCLRYCLVALPLSASELIKSINGYVEDENDTVYEDGMEMSDDNIFYRKEW